MSETVLTVLNVLLSLLGLAFLIWLSVRSLRNSGSPVKVILKWVFTLPFVLFCMYLARRMGPYGPLMIVFMAVVLSLMWTGHISEIIFSPLTSLFDGGNEAPEKKPAYSVAMAKRRLNRPLEAIMAIREQLAKFPKDFEGIMLLANIQAEDMNDLPGAEVTLYHFCNLPGAPERQIMAALTQLADWHIKKGPDVDSARAALQQIVERFPGTEWALRAEQRIAHLGETEKIILAKYDRQNVAVPEGVNNVGLLDSTEFLKPKEVDPGKLAAVYVTHLEQHPHDADVREKLATIYARDFHRLDLATMELAYLINEPRYTPKQVAGWLNQLANFQIDLGADEGMVRETLEKIVANFPGSPAAEQAIRRMARLASEFKGKKQTPNVKLGVYEQNIGLKYGSPRKL